MTWLAQYKARRTTAEAAVRLVESGNLVYCGGNAATPGALVRALAARRDELTDVRLTHLLLLGEDPLAAPEMAGHFRHNSVFVGAGDRRAVEEGRADYLPVFLHQIPRLFTERHLPLDVAMVVATPPDEHGYMSFGVENSLSRAACASARTVIVQVNERMPRVMGDTFLHVGQVTAVVEQAEELPELPRRPPGEVERRIGAHLRGLIEDGATLQMGIGGIPDAVWEALDGAADLGIHTEMLSDGAMRAIERGTVTGARKTLHPGKAVIGFAMGSRALYDFLHDNPAIEAHPIDHVNDPFVIAQNDRMVAINSALEVDLTGQVCSDSIGPHIYSGFGGQVDFIRGAARSRGGRAVIALPATARGGQESRIVPFLKQGAGVVTTRADVHDVVTEHGVARLFGRNLRQRAEALIAIAAPAFRGELLAAARERRLL